MNQTPRPTAAQTEQMEAAWAAQDLTGFDHIPVDMLKAVFLAGEFLRMLLTDMKGPPDYIESRCVAFGRYCVGRDPWEAFDLVWPRCLADMTSIMEDREWSDTPVPQDVPPETPTMAAWRMSAKMTRDEKGVFPQQFFVLTETGLEVHALAVDGRAAFDYAIKTAGKKPIEFILGVDMSSVPGQALDLENFLAVIWYVGGQFYTGVLEYALAVGELPAGQDEYEFREINWNNNYWNNALRPFPISKMIEALA